MPNNVAFDEGYDARIGTPCTHRWLHPTASSGFASFPILPQPTIRGGRTSPTTKTRQVGFVEAISGKFLPLPTGPVYNDTFWKLWAIENAPQVILTARLSLLSMEVGEMISLACAKDPVPKSLPVKYQHALQCGDVEERRSCLKKTAEAGYIPAMYEYGLMCEDAAERKRWLREAAHEGYLPAMYHYALECEDGEWRKSWLLQAARQGHFEAMYQYSIECDDAVEALYWLREAAWEGHPLAIEACALQCEEAKNTAKRSRLGTGRNRSQGVS